MEICGRRFDYGKGELEWMGKGLDRVLGWGGEVSECWFGRLEQITYRTAPLKPNEVLSGPPAGEADKSPLESLRHPPPAQVMEGRETLPYKNTGVPNSNSVGQRMSNRTRRNGAIAVKEEQRQRKLSGDDPKGISMKEREAHGRCGNSNTDAPLFHQRGDDHRSYNLLDQRSYDDVARGMRQGDRPRIMNCTDDDCLEADNQTYPL